MNQWNAYIRYISTVLGVYKKEMVNPHPFMQKLDSSQRLSDNRIRVTFFKLLRLKRTKKGRYTVNSSCYKGTLK